MKKNYFTGKEIIDFLIEVLSVLSLVKKFLRNI